MDLRLELLQYQAARSSSCLCSVTDQLGVTALILATLALAPASLTFMKEDTSAVFMVLRLAGPTLGALLATLLVLALLSE